MLACFFWRVPQLQAKPCMDNFTVLNTDKIILSRSNVLFSNMLTEKILTWPYYFSNKHIVFTWLSQMTWWRPIPSGVATSVLRKCSDQKQIEFHKCLWEWHKDSHGNSHWQPKCREKFVFTWGQILMFIPNPDFHFMNMESRKKKSAKALVENKYIER